VVGGVVGFTYFYDNDGVLRKRISEGTEQDTFSANSKTLVSDRYHFTFVLEFDENGVRVAYHESGFAERLQLPGGGVFIVAGRVDVLAEGGGLSWQSTRVTPGTTWTRSARL
jgi:hypothetical protein